MKPGRRAISFAVAVLALGAAACGGRSQAVLPQQASVPQLALLVPAAAKITLKPASLAFKNTGTAFAKSVTVSDPGYTGKIAESLTACKRVAKPSVASGDGPKYTVKITPLRSGRCSIVFSDTAKRKATLPISVTTPSPSPSPSVSPSSSPGPVVANPTSATICPASGIAACSTHSQTVTLSQANYSGSFSELDNCPSFVAHLSSAGTASYSVAGQTSSGTCTATFVGGGGKFTTVPITVVGNVTASPSPVQLCPSSGTDACSPHTTNVGLSQANYTGNFTESDNCGASVVTIAQLNSSTYKVTGGSILGSCTATFTGALGESINVSIQIVKGVVINVKKERTP